MPSMTTTLDRSHAAPNRPRGALGQAAQAVEQLCKASGPKVAADPLRATVGWLAERSGMRDARR